MKHSHPTSVLVVGAGAAGISAAIWLDDFGVDFDWIEADGDIGGILHRVHNEIDNYPAAVVDDGAQLVDLFREQLRHLDLHPRRARLASVERATDHVIAVDDQGDRQRVTYLLIATGTTYRRLGVPGEKEALGDRVSQSAMADAPRFSGQEVAVVGGGDSGFENALVLADHDCDVSLYLRNPRFRARPEFVSAVRDHPRITIAEIPSIIRRIESRDTGVRLHIDQNGTERSADVAALFVRIGVEPVLPPGCEGLDLDERGFLVVDHQGQTSDAQILAAGDIISASLRSVATAVGSGARAARRCAQALGHLPPLEQD